MGTFGSETDALVVSVNDASSFYLHKVRASDAYAGEEPALALPGTTLESAVVAANITAGGAQVVAFGDPSEWINITATSQANSSVSASELIQFGPASSNIAVSVSPQSVTSQQNLTGWTQQYSASVSGSTNQQVIWSVNGVVGGNQQFGTISTTGLYQNTAGGEYGDDIVTATSVADPAKSGIAYIAYFGTIVCENNPTDLSCLSIVLSPLTATVGPNQTMKFTAILDDPSDPNPKVTWAVNGITGGNATVGTISTTGLYTAPAVSSPSPASGTVAVLSTYDQLLLLVDVNTWTITKSIRSLGRPGHTVPYLCGHHERQRNRRIRKPRKRDDNVRIGGCFVGSGNPAHEHNFPPFGRWRRQFRRDETFLVHAGSEGCRTEQIAPNPLRQPGHSISAPLPRSSSRSP